MCWETGEKGLYGHMYFAEWTRGKDNWYYDYVVKFGEVRHAVLLEMKGFGPKEGKRSGSEKWETLVVVFRKGQAYCEGRSFRKDQRSHRL